MKNKRAITGIAVFIAMFAVWASSAGIFSVNGPGPTEFVSVHGKKVMLYGKGIYRNMSAEVAPQGIAQDYVTLFIAVPLLLAGLVWYLKGSMRGKVLLAGTLAYFLVTYLFFTMMGMYNQLFLLWVILLSLSFHGFILVFYDTWKSADERSFVHGYPVRFIGGFLVFNAVAIGLLWLSVIIPPALKGTVPLQVEHYTTLVVQALDLAVGLPLAFIAGWLLYRKKRVGYILAPVYTVFLAILMTALTAKVIAMGMVGASIVPVVFIIPTFNLLSVICAVVSVKAVVRTAKKNR